MPVPSLRPQRPHPFATALLLGLAAVVFLPETTLAQRELHWDRLDVEAHLEADGRLVVVETQAIVFNGDWNGGERVFNIRPRQQLLVSAVEREGPGGWVALTRDPSLDDVDDYDWADEHTLRWRSRLPSDPPFVGATIRYRIAYELSGILLTDGTTYRLDHDFVFPDRDGVIREFTLRLTFEPAWQPQSAVQPVYTAGPLAAGTGFVLDVPLAFTGAEPPSVRDTRRPREIGLGVALILGVTIVGVLWLFVREQRLGRFAPLTTAIDDAWLAEHILEHPAEVVAAAWDENVGTAEVTSLIARMVDDKKLRSTVGKGKGASADMTLHLLVDRARLHGHERVLVDKLFVDGGTVTSTKIVKAHYKKTGFSPANEIEPELQAAVEAMLPAGRPPRRFPIVAAALMALGVVLIGWNWFRGYPGAFALTIPMLVLTGVGWGAGFTFRGYLHWGVREALLCLLPAFVIALGASIYLWFYAASGRIELPPLTVIGLVAVTLACIHSAINALKTRRHRAALAFRKTLTAGRIHFINELEKDEPALRDEWYPWLLAFELTPQMDAWSTRAEGSVRPRRSSEPFSTTSSSTETSGGRTWTGFGGGRSGGAGGGASWQAAVSGMAAGVSAPSSGGSSGGSSSGGGSSGGGSSGGGGGGGW